jgi:hypothetical protein
MKLLLMYHKYLFFRIYLWNLNSFGKDELPILNSLLGVSLINCFQIFSLIFFLDGWIKFFDVNVVLFIFIVSLMVLFVNYLLLGRRERFEEIVILFQSETNENSERNNVWIAGYILGTLVLFIISIAV